MSMNHTIMTMAGTVVVATALITGTINLAPIQVPCCEFQDTTITWNDPNSTGICPGLTRIQEHHNSKYWDY